MTACSSGKVGSGLNPSEGTFLSQCGYGYAQKPSSITLTCADGGMYLDKIVYKSWSDTMAQGNGVFYMNNCDPSCSSGTEESFPVMISLSKPIKDSQNRSIFSLLVIDSKTKLYNGQNSASFDIGFSPETSGDLNQETQSPPTELDPEQATQDLLRRLNSQDNLWELNLNSKTPAGIREHQRLGLYSQPDFILQCTIPYGSTWLFVYSDEDAAYDAFNSDYFFRTSYYSAEFAFDPITNLFVLIHTSMGGNRTCLNSADQQLDPYATD